MSPWPGERCRVSEVNFIPSSAAEEQEPLNTALEVKNRRNKIKIKEIFPKNFSGIAFTLYNQN
jgi:hypothetical protein